MVVVEVVVVFLVVCSIGAGSCAFTGNTGVIPARSMSIAAIRVLIGVLILTINRASGYLCRTARKVERKIQSIDASRNVNVS